MGVPKMQLFCMRLSDVKLLHRGSIYIATEAENSPARFPASLIDCFVVENTVVLENTARRHIQRLISYAKTVGQGRGGRR